MPPDNVTPDIWFPNLGFYFERVPENVLSIGNITIAWYGLLIVAGIISAYFLAIWWARKTNQRTEDYTDLLLLGVVLAFVGLRAYYVVFNWELFRGRGLMAIIDIRQGGLAIYGGIIGAVIAGLIIGKLRGIPFTTLADTCAPSLLLGQVIGRFGNFFNAEAFGGFTDNVLAMRIRVDRARYTTPELLERAIEANGATYIQVHPTFFYEAAINFVLMILLILYRPHKKFNGEIILLYFLGYGIARFFIEGLRTDQLIFFGTGWPASQVVSVVFVVVSLVLLIMGHMTSHRRGGGPDAAPVRSRRRGRR